MPITEYINLTSVLLFLYFSCYLYNCLVNQIPKLLLEEYNVDCHEHLNIKYKPKKISIWTYKDRFNHQSRDFYYSLPIIGFFLACRNQRERTWHFSSELLYIFLNLICYWSITNNTLLDQPDTLIEPLLLYAFISLNLTLFFIDYQIKILPDILTYPPFVARIDCIG